MKNNWLEEAKKSRAILFNAWQRLGKPKGDFYHWLLEQIEESSKEYANSKKVSGKLDQAFKATIG